MYSKILAANDGSPGSLKALDTAIALARQVSAELYMVTVEELPRFPASIDEAGPPIGSFDWPRAPCWW